MSRALLLLLLTLPALRAQAQRANVPLPYKAVLTLERAPFNASGKALKYASDQPGQKFLIAIDGKPFFGTDGEVPKYVLAKAALRLNGITYNLRVDKMYNPWFGSGPQARPNSELFRLRKKGTNYLLQAIFSDGTGWYLAEWKIVDRMATRTVLTTDEEQIVGIFYAPNPRR